MSNDLRNTTVDEVDSDIDDLLDDVLDDMTKLSTTNTQSSQTKTTATSVTNEKSNGTKTTVAETTEENVAEEPDLDELLGSDDFAKQLAAGMEQLMGQMDGETDEEMKKAFEKVWASFDNDKPLPKASSSTAQLPKDTAAQPKTAQSFQETINKTMNKLKDSSKEIDSSINEESEDAFMAELMKQMESLADNGEFEGVLEGMMNQLMSKELLYEPMRDLRDKYPAWLEEHKEKTDKAAYEKYKQQYQICQQIVAKYEAPDFDEKNEAQAKEIMDLMTKMQDLGQPPTDLLDEMAPGMNFGNPESMPDIKDLENCNIM